MELPFAPACERNQHPISEALREIFITPGVILELASGTGQHGVYMAGALPHLHWQCTDLEAVIPGLAARISQSELPNLPSPKVLDVGHGQWPDIAPTGVFAANVLHIASWESVSSLFLGCARALPAGGQLVIYGPFNQDGFTSEGNRSLDAWARETFDGGGLRELSAVTELAGNHQFLPPAVRPMPANNLLLTLERGV